MFSFCSRPPIREYLRAHSGKTATSPIPACPLVMSTGTIMEWKRAMNPPGSHASEQSRRQRLKATGGRGIELGPVDLLLETMIGLIADRAVRAQALERLALMLDRAQPQLVVLRRGLRIVRLLRHSAGGSVLLAHGSCCG